MYICEPCLERNFNNWSMSRSYGKCEICEEMANCADIPSSRLDRKIAKVDNEKLRKEEIEYIYELLQATL